MPSDLLNLLYKGAREALAKNAPPETKISAFNLVINQIENEIEICNEHLSKKNAELHFTDHGIHREIGLKNDIKITKDELELLLKLREEISKRIALFSQPTQPAATTYKSTEETGTNQMKIFVSHSEKNVDIATALVNYLLSGLIIDDKDIRASSVAGHGFKFGDLKNNIKNDLDEAPILIALVTKESLESYWVMMELGAAWILSKKMIPILASDIRHNDLHEIIKANHYIEISNDNASAKLSEMIAELSSDLRIEQKNGGKRQACLEKFINLFKA